MTKTATLIFKTLSNLGIIMLLIAGYLYFKSVEFKKNAFKTTGLIVELVNHKSSTNKKRLFAPKVCYYIASKQYFYLSKTSTSNPLYKVGKKIIVYYDPKNIRNVELEGLSSYSGILFTGGLGLLYILFGIIPLYLQKRKQEKNVWLRQNGRKIQAHFEGVILKKVYQVNRKSPYIITAQFLDILNNKVYNFKSEDIWYDPKSYIQNNKTINVFVDANNYKKYYVDISFLPKEG